MSEIKLAVLDMAGTTVRDDGVVEAAFVEALLGMGIEDESAELARHLEHVRVTMGQSKIEVFGAIFDGDEVRAVDATRRFEVAFDAAITRGEIEPLPGAETALSDLSAMGVLICLTTGFSAETRERLMDVLGWRDLVDLSLSPEPGVRGRPHPDLVLSALMRLEVEAVAEVAVVGDTVNDLISGRRAGAAIVAGVLTGAHDRDQLEVASPTHILSGIGELPRLIQPA